MADEQVDSLIIQNNKYKPKIFDPGAK